MKTKTWLLVLIILVMIIDTKFELIQKLGLSEGWQNFIKLVGAVASIVIAKFQSSPLESEKE